VTFDPIDLSVAMWMAWRATKKDTRARPDEMKQAALIGLWKAQRDFDGRLNWISYRNLRINGEIIDAVRQLLGRGRAKFLQAQLGEIEEVLCPCESAEEIVAREDEHEWLRCAINTLVSEDHRVVKVLRGRLAGATYPEIGAEHGVCGERAYQLRKHGTTLLRNVYSDEARARA